MASATTIVELILDMEPAEFLTVQDEFLQGVTEILQVDLSEVWIADIQKGCTILILVLPDRAEHQFLDSFGGPPPDQARKFRSQFKVRKGGKSGTVEAPALALSGQIRRSISERTKSAERRRFTWLHISDLHALVPGDGRAFEQSIVCSKFLDQLPALLRAHKIVPDVVFFTGDIAQSGLPAEYEVAGEFNRRLLEVLPKEARLFFIPGNHDANWNLIDETADAALRSSLTSRLAVTKHLLDSSSELAREQGLLRLNHYQNFAASSASNGQPPCNHKYFYTAKWLHDGLTIGVAGLNSAWRCTKKPKPVPGVMSTDLDLGQLLLSEPQLSEAIDDLKDCDLKFALVHHPPRDSWFADFDKQIQDNYLGEFDYILRGHEHRFTADVWGQLEPKRQTTIFAAGALYQDSPWPKLFNAVVLHIDTRKQTLYKWTYEDYTQRWQAVVEPGAKQPGMKSSLTERLRKRVFPDP